MPTKLCHISIQPEQIDGVFTMPHADLFYEPTKGERSGLPHDPFKSFVIARPIGWVSTTSKEGQDNLAPYSQFTNVSFDPPTIMFVGHQSVYEERSKDSVLNCIATNEFVWNMARYPSYMHQQMKSH